MNTPFVGRQEELREFNKLFKKSTASLVVIQGRRRIGKTRFVEEFAKGLSFFRFSGLPPTQKTTQQS